MIICKLKLYFFHSRVVFANRVWLWMIMDVVHLGQTNSSVWLLIFT